MLLVILGIVLAANQVWYIKQKRAGKTPGFLTSIGCLVVALFCAYGFLASGELTGTAELAWKVVYAAAGLISLGLAVWQAIKRN